MEGFTLILSVKLELNIKITRVLRPEKKLTRRTCRPLQATHYRARLLCIKR